MATSAQLREQIAAGRWDGPLAALYGTAPQELARQRARYCAALEQFELYFGPGRQVQVYSAPGRAELGGNHTDHQHGYGLAAAVTLDLVAVAARNTDGYVRVKSRGFNKLDVIDLATAEPQEGESTHSASLIRGIAEGFRTAGKTIGGFDAYTASDVLRGSGLSSSAAFEMGMACIWNGEYACGLDARALAGICQYAENTYFGKPSGQLDQLASAVGGVIFADFADPAAPQVEKIHADGLLPPGMTLCVTDTRGSHSELTGEFAAIRQEMEAVAACLGGKVLGQVPETDFWAALPRLRTACGDRAVLRHPLLRRKCPHAGPAPGFAGKTLCRFCRAGAGKRARLLCTVPECVLRHGCPASGAVGGACVEPEHPAGQQRRMADAGRRLCGHHSGLCARNVAAALPYRHGAGVRPGQLLCAPAAGTGRKTSAVTAEATKKGLLQICSRPFSIFDSNGLSAAGRNWSPAGLQDAGPFPRSRCPAGKWRMPAACCRHGSQTAPRS